VFRFILCLFLSAEKFFWRVMNTNSPTAVSMRNISRSKESLYPAIFNSTSMALFYFWKIPFYLHIVFIPRNILRQIFTGPQDSASKVLRSRLAEAKCLSTAILLTSNLPLYSARTRLFWPSVYLMPFASCFHICNPEISLRGNSLIWIVTLDWKEVN